jgi:hypothetical protein
MIKVIINEHCMIDDFLIETKKYIITFILKTKLCVLWGSKFKILVFYVIIKRNV